MCYVSPESGKSITSAVEFEWIGLLGSLEGGGERGANATSADALVIGDTSSGRCAYLMEWKYVEEYRVGESLGEGRSGCTRHSRYQHLYDADGSPFNGVATLDDLLYDPLYQIMRLHLLADRMIREREFDISEAKVVVVCPEDNLAYRNRITSPPLVARFGPTSTLETVVRSLLESPAEFIMTSQDRMVEALRHSALAYPLADWLQYHNERYGW